MPHYYGRGSGSSPQRHLAPRTTVSFPSWVWQGQVEHSTRRTEEKGSVGEILSTELIFFFCCRGLILHASFPLHEPSRFNFKNTVYNPKKGCMGLQCEIMSCTRSLTDVVSLLNHTAPTPKSPSSWGTNRRHRVLHLLRRWNWEAMNGRTRTRSRCNK